MWIERPPKFFRLLFPGAVFRIPSGSVKPGTVYITFDDGPIPESTPIVLNILDRYDVKATFFMVGDNVRKYPHLLEEVRKRNHVAANHSFHHIRGAGISPLKYLKDVEECEKLTGSGIVRPAHGWIMPGQLRLLKKHFKVVMFDLVTRDYAKNVSAEEIVDNVKKYARDGSIIVFHDSLKSIEKLKTALPQSLHWLKEQGYKFALIN